MNKPKQGAATSHVTQRQREQELEELRCKPGVEGERNRIVFGSNEGEWELIVQADYEAERRAKPWAFVDKFTGRRRKRGGGLMSMQASSRQSVVQDNPFTMAEGARHPPASRLLSEADVASLYAAFAFSWAWGLPMDTTITISWRLLGPEFEADVQKSFSQFLKSMRTWLASSAYPLSAIYGYVHEQGPVIGTHTHIAIHLPQHPWPRLWFRKWVKTWERNAAGGPRPRAIKVDCRINCVQPWQHWRAFSYFVKGYDRNAVVLRSPDLAVGPDRYLGEMIAYAWADPGMPAVDKRFGVSDSINTGAQALGVPGVGDLQGSARLQLAHPSIDPFRPNRCKPHPALEGWRPGPFKSAYAMGARDVRKLYPPEFIAMVDRGRSRPPYKGPMQLEAELAAAMEKIRQLEQLADAESLYL